MLPENPLDGPCEASQLVDIEDGHLSDLVIRLLEKCYLCYCRSSFLKMSVIFIDPEGEIGLIGET